MSELEKLLADSEGLLPCPFCGGKAELECFAGWQVSCFNAKQGCKIFVHTESERGTKEDATKIWNTRPREDKLAAICRVLIEDMDKYITRAFNHGNAAGILEDKANHSISEVMKNNYLERKEFWHKEFKGLLKQALRRAEEIAEE